MSTNPTKPTSSGRAASPAQSRASALPDEVTATVAPRRQSQHPEAGKTAEVVAETALPLAASAAAPAVTAMVALAGSTAPPTAVSAAGVEAPETHASSPKSASNASRQPRIRRRPRPKIRAGQVVCWQLAAALIGFSAGRAWWIVAAGTIPGVALLALTMTWHHRQWTYQWALLRLGYVVRDKRFVPVGAIRGGLEIGDTEAATIVRPDGLTVLLEVDAPSESLPRPSALLDQHREHEQVERWTSATDSSDLRVKLLLQNGRTWIALTAPRTVGCHRDAELELLLANAVRRLLKRLRTRKVPAWPLPADELADVLTRLTPDHAREGWNELRLWTGRYRMYEIPPDLASIPAGAVTITVSGDLDHALLLAPAGTQPGRGSVPLTGRQRSSFVAALP